MDTCVLCAACSLLNERWWWVQAKGTGVLRTYLVDHDQCPQALQSYINDPEPSTGSFYSDAHRRSTKLLHLKSLLEQKSVAARTLQSVSPTH